MNINTATLSAEAKQALRNFGVAAARYHAAQKKEVTVHFRFSEGTEYRYVPRSIETDYIDSKLQLRNFEELKEIADSVDCGLRLDALEPTRFTEGAAEREAQSYADMVQVEKEIAAFASTL